MKNFRRIVDLIVGGTSLLLLTGCAKLPEEPTSYHVVAMRSPSDVAMAHAPGAPVQSLLGRELVLGKQLQWIDGKTHDQWKSVRIDTTPLGRGDPMFADVYWEPEGAAGDSRTLRYQLDGQAIGTVVFVDTQLALISAPGGSPVYVLEKGLSREMALQVETALQDRKFDPGPVDGVIDEQTRRALGFYYDYLGLEYRFKPPVISTAILRELIGAPKVD